MRAINCKLCNTLVTVYFNGAKYCPSCSGKSTKESSKRSSRKYTKNNMSKTVEWARNERIELRDNYIKRLLKTKNVTTEMIEQKKLQLKITRKIKQIQTQLK